MADAFASAAVAAVGGLSVDEWLSRNHVCTTLRGDELVDVYSLEGPCVPLGKLMRKECAILLRNPQKWRANSALSWYYEPDVTTPVLTDSSSAGRLRVVKYRDAILLSAKEDGPSVVVVPLCCQQSRPPRGSRFAIPSQFACDAVTAGAGGVAYRDDHIAVGYLNAIQTLCHHAADAKPDALAQWFDIIGFLLDDLGGYMAQLSDVQTVVEHLRASEIAPDMLQRALSFVVSRKPFSTEERLRLLEIVLKRTFKLHASLLSIEAVKRVVSTIVLVPILYGMHRGVIKVAAAAAHFARMRSGIFGSAETWAAEAAAADAAMAVIRREKYAGLATAARIRKEAMQAAGPGISAATVCELPAAVATVSEASKLVRPERPTTPMAIPASAEALHEAKLVCIIVAATGLVLPLEPTQRFVAFCKERDEQPEHDGDADDEDDAATVATCKSKASGRSTTKKSTWQFSAGCSAGRGADRASDWRAGLKSRGELDAEAAMAASADARRNALYRPVRSTFVRDSGMLGPSSSAAASRRGSNASSSVDWSCTSSVHGGSSRGSGGLWKHTSYSPTQSSTGTAHVSAADAAANWRSPQQKTSPGDGVGRSEEAVRTIDTAGRVRPPLSGMAANWRTGKAVDVALPKQVLPTNSSMKPLALNVKPTVTSAVAPAAAPPVQAVAGSIESGNGKPRRWRVRNAGIRADLVGLGLLQPQPLPFSITTGGVFRGEIELPEQVTVTESTTIEAVTAGVESDLPAPSFLAAALAYPFDSDGPGAFALRLVPEYPTLAIPPVAGEAAATVEIQVLMCLRAPEMDAHCEFTGHASAVATMSSASPVAAAVSGGSEDGDGDDTDVAAAAAAVASVSPMSTPHTIRAPVTLLVVLDKSGSMASDDKMASLKHTVHFILDQLSPHDAIAITAFDSAAHPLLQLGCINSPETAAAAHASVESLTADGGTDIARGLAASVAVCFADSQAPSSSSGAPSSNSQHQLCSGGNRLCAVLLLTDGQDGAGGGSQRYDTIVEHIAPLGIPIHTFGFGADHDSSTLMRFAEQTGGSFAYVESAEQVAEAFASCLGGLTSCVSRDVQLHFDVAGVVTGGGDDVVLPCQITAVASSFAHTINGDGSTGSVTLGALYAEERREVLVTLQVPAAAAAAIAAQNTLGASVRVTARATYTHLSRQSAMASRTVVLTVPLACSTTPSAASALVPSAVTARAPIMNPSPHIEVVVARCRELAATNLQRVVRLNDTGDISTAADLLRTTTETLLSSPAVAHPVVMALVDELEALRSASATSEGLNRGARAAALSAISTHATQRFTGGAAASLASTAAYQVASQARMLLAARRARGVTGLAAGAAVTVPSGGWGDMRPRSNFDRAMAAEVRLEPQQGGGATAAAANSVLVTGAITTAWSAAQLTQDGSYTLTLRRLGICADSELQPALAEYDTSGSSSAVKGHGVSAEGYGLVPALRITFGSVLFGDSDGLLLLHSGSNRAKPEASLRTHAGSTARLDFDAGLHIVLGPTSVSVQQGGVEGPLTVIQRPQMAAPLPLLLGIENVAVLILMQ